MSATTPTRVLPTGNEIQGSTRINKPRSRRITSLFFDLGLKPPPLQETATCTTKSEDEVSCTIRKAPKKRNTLLFEIGLSSLLHQNNTLSLMDEESDDIRLSARSYHEASVPLKRQNSAAQKSMIELISGTSTELGRKKSDLHVI